MKSFLWRLAGHLARGLAMIWVVTTFTFVLIRLISIPDSIPPPAGRGIGIWISLLASLGVIVAGLLRASEEL